MERVKSFVGEIFLLLVVLLVVCIAELVDIRNEQFPREEENIKAINALLENDRKNIDNMEKEISIESKEVDEAKRQMDSLKNSNKSDEWNNSVINYNTKLFKYQKDIKDYANKLDEYNKKYNKLNLTGKKTENVLDWIKSILGI